MAIDIDLDKRIAFLTLNRPESGNRLDATTLDEISQALAELANDTNGPTVLVLGAAGPDFSLGREQAPGAAQTPKAITAEFTRVQQVNEQLQHSPLVTIAAVRGQAVGAGLSLAGRCDIVIVADDARLSFPEIPRGIPPTIVLSHYRYVLPRNLLGDLIFTGRELSGWEAVPAGLAARAVADDDVEATAAAIAEQIAGYDPRTLRLVKEFLARTENLPPRDAPALGIAMYAVEMADRSLLRS
ncbi:enoyl-CoA hydratase/isomerase family protein [Saxibacter everestensis]|uniref:Enoyl-CoA hydratase/isomerase family protein n=1 Tax=Saxibacter everestensis TaxID=2909229 RepID=A0ABY8QRQ0_9MICO|nr:enoyl-CoA hydratase/isomerase family protein [Brevibacteriaceae bacterium ZFBP1038]